MRNVSRLSNGLRKHGANTLQAPSGFSPRVENLLARCRPGWSLPREFYFDEEIYRLDLDAIWRRGWLFAGHSCEITRVGDYFTLPVDRDSIIVIRSDDAAVRAFYNVCRHRGSFICADDR